MEVGNGSKGIFDESGEKDGEQEEEEATFVICLQRLTKERKEKKTRKFLFREVLYILAVIKYFDPSRVV